MTPIDRTHSHATCIVCGATMDVRTDEFPNHKCIKKENLK